MSLLTIVGQLLRSLYSDQELPPYALVTTHDIIGDYQPLRMWKRKLAARLVYALLRLVPTSRRAPDNREHFLEWGAGLLEREHSVHCPARRCVENQR